MAGTGGAFGRTSDQLAAGAGADVILAAYGQPDTIDCGADVDTLDRDRSESRVDGCEGTRVGRLRMAPRTVHARAGDVARLRLDWRHPRLEVAAADRAAAP